MGKTEEWVARENIARFREKIAEVGSAGDKAALKRLLAAEERKLNRAAQARDRPINS